MIKKEITYKNFNDEEEKEEFYFNLTRNELLQLELSEKGGLANAYRRIIRESDGKKIVEIFKWIVEQSYGVRSSDGKKFYKTPTALEEFKASGAYDQLLFDLMSDSDGFASTFANGLLPADLVAQVEAEAESKRNQDTLPEEPESTPSRAISE